MDIENIANQLQFKPPQQQIQRNVDINPSNPSQFTTLSKMYEQKHLNQQMLKTTQIQHQTQSDQKIKQIIAPVKVKLVQAITTDFKQSALQKLSVQNKLSQIYTQIMTQLIDYAAQINPQTGKPMEINNIPIYKFIQHIISLDFPVHQLLMQILQNMRTNELMFRKYVSLILHTCIQGAETVLQLTKFCIEPNLGVKILFNQKCITVEEADQKTLMRSNSSILNAKLQNIQNNAYNLDMRTVVHKIIFQQLKNKGNQQVETYKKANVGSWSVINAQDLVNPRKLILQRLYKQSNELQQFMTTHGKKINMLFEDKVM